MFAKLFSSITESSLWSEPKEVRLLFVSMLARADQNGFVEASIPGLARVANLTLEETQFALEVLQNPDPHSKNPADEGRRITKVPGGFALINYDEYRSRRDENDRKEYMRNYMVEYRKSRKQPVNNVNDGKHPLAAVSQEKPPLANTEAEAEADKPAASFSDPVPKEHSNGKPAAPPECWEIPERLNTGEVRELLEEFAQMRRSIKKPIKSYKRASKVLDKFDDVAHLTHALEMCIANDWQGLSVDYRPNGAKVQSKKPAVIDRVLDQKRDCPETGGVYDPSYPYPWKDW